MSKPTPGPWEYRENGDGGDFIVCPKGFNTIIAEVIAEDVPAVESEANARIIADLPLMISALRTFIRMDELGEEITGGQWNAAIVMARAALTNAENGDTP